MNAPHIDPVIFSNPLGIRWYSLMYALGLFFLYFYLRRESREKRLSYNIEQIENTLLIGLISMLIGSRLFYIIFYNPKPYLDDFTNIFKLWEGGLSFHGAMLGVTLGVYIYTQKHKLNFLQLADAVSCGIGIGLFCGRIGNFINGELWGRVTDVPWGLIFHDAGPLPRHPSQLYEAFFEGLFLFFIMQFLKTKTETRGVLTGSFLVLYSLSRFTVEFFREPDEELGLLFMNLSMGQLLSLLMGIIGISVILTRKISYRSA
jgi:phosphatidylglycerol:prolipoprotein diacylglycerol transferase